MNLQKTKRYINVRDLGKYVHYLIEQKSFQANFDGEAPTEQLQQLACQLRGTQRDPAVMIHGIMPRAGTVYVGQLLRLHPDLHAFPHDWWEVPFLQLSADILQLQEQFLVNHRHNRGKLEGGLFLTLFGSALIAHLHTGIKPNKRLLIKAPSVEYLHFFWTMYPHEHLLLLIRDGRDVVDSTIRTWPQIRFSFACRRWRRAANMVYQFHEHHQKRQQGYWLARFEDAVVAPKDFIREACRRFRLDENKYPFEQLNSETKQIRGSSNLKENGEVIWDVQEKPDDFQPTGYWKAWPWHKKWLFKRIAGDMLIKLGYCENLDW